MAELELAQIVMLTIAALAAGTVDAIAGGGGLLTLPALVAAGVPPHMALGTNKGQSVFGSGSALALFARRGLIAPRRAAFMFPAGFAGSMAGAALVLLVSPQSLRPLILVLLAAAAVMVTTLRPRPAAERVERGRHIAIAVAIAAAVGMYDGFFGPGTGTFLIVLFAALLGETLLEASANAKVVNFATNLAAVVVFASQGLIDWRIAIPMGVAQLTGGQIGARLAILGGQKVVRAVALSVVVALMGKIGWDILSAGLSR
jgi:uncharacterized membrane protein YfcA